MSKRPGDLGYAAGWCIHYRAQGHNTCEAGIPYSNFYGVEFNKRPCFLDNDTGESKQDALQCEHLRRPTKEEIAAHKEWTKRKIVQMGTVMKAIDPWRKAHKGKSASEVVECPVCKGQLHLSIAAVNGHIHGRCETTDCVAWME